jgi:penicillin-binding protein 1A
MNRLFKNLFALILLGSVLVTLLGGMIYFIFSRNLPEIIKIQDYKPLTVTQILSADQKVVAEFYKERRYLTPYSEIPKHVIQAFISAEDDTFFQHQGVNFASIIRAQLANLKAGHVVQGGSTITQQVAKSLLLSSEKSYVRKIREFILAGRIESNLTKEEILYLYLNQSYLGHGAYGVAAAAKAYFRKSVRELTIPEGAILAGMLQAPGKYSPLLNPKRAKERQLYVLRRMMENKFINSSQMQEAATLPIRVYDDEDQVAEYAPYAVEQIRRYLLDRFGEEALYEQGLIVETVLKKDLSITASRALKEGLRTVDKRLGYRGPIKQFQSGPEKELAQERVAIIKGSLGYQMFMPDGTVRADESIKSAGLKGDIELLKEGQLYFAYVTQVEDSKKSASVLVGAIRGEVPFETMKWARRVRESNGQTFTGVEPSRVSQVLTKGDWIRVRFLSTPAGSSVAKFALEQDPVLQGALFSFDIQSGSILAMEGGYDFRQSEFNRVTQSQRQPGSSYKPFIFSAALERGFNPASIIVDSPIVYEDAENGTWKPTNFEEKFYGDTTFRQALIKSRNVPTIKLVQAIQVGSMLNYNRRIGLKGKFPSDLSLALGSGAVSLWNLTEAFSLFPRLGKKITPVLVTSIKDRSGKVLAEKLSGFSESGATPNSDSTSKTEPNPVPTDLWSELQNYPSAKDSNQVMDPRVAAVMTHLMKEVITYGTGQDARTLGRPAAGKTGTTNDYQDAWFMGFTPTVVTGAWVGYDTQRPIGSGETGARAALPIWLGFMREAVKAYPEGDFSVPPGVTYSSIHSVTGKAVSANAAGAIQEAFIEGTQPSATQSSGGANNSPPAASGSFFKEDSE